MEFVDRVAIVTGGGSGMGEAISHRLAAEGAHVAVWDLDAQRASTVTQTIVDAGGTARGYTVDVASAASVGAATAAVVDELGVPSLLVNSAGITHVDHMLDLSFDLWRRVLAVNLDGPFNTTAEVGRAMAGANGGAIVNISSQAGLQGFARKSAYVASKSGLVGLTRSAAIDLAQHRIRVNAIAPSAVDTPLLRSSWALSGGSAEASAARNLLGRIGTTSDIAELTLFLLSDRSSYVTGQVVACDGGASINGNPAASINASPEITTK